MEADFSSDGISLRRYQVTDIPLLYEAVRESISELSTWMPWCHPDYQFANLGYWVRSSRAGRGVATTATLLTARFGLQTLALQRIEILAAVGNRASQRVAEKAGAKKEGVLPAFPSWAAT